MRLIFVLLTLAGIEACAHTLHPDWSQVSRDPRIYSECHASRPGQPCRGGFDDPESFWEGVCTPDPQAHGALLCVSTIEWEEPRKRAHDERPAPVSPVVAEAAPSPLALAFRACDHAAAQTRRPSLGKAGFDVHDFADGHRDVECTMFEGLRPEHVQCLLEAVRRYGHRHREDVDISYLHRVTPESAE